MTPYKEYAIKLDKAFKRARTNYGPDYVISMNQHWDEVSENINNL